MTLLALTPAHGVRFVAVPASLGVADADAARVRDGEIGADAFMFIRMAACTAAQRLFEATPAGSC